jgi:hypothetical protein
MITSNLKENFWKDISPEAHLILKCAKLKLTEIEIQEISKLIAQIQDWTLFEKIALQTKLASLCFHSLVLKNEMNIPKGTKEFLARVYNKILAKNIVILKEFSDLKKILNRAEIPYIPLKGIRLVEEIYKDLGLRHLSDIDILFVPEDSTKVRALFLEFGYAEYVVDENKWIRKWTKNPSPFQYQKNQNFIDFHIGLNRVGDVRIDVLDFWKTARKKDNSHEFELNNTYEFVHLCFHCYKHLIKEAQNLIWLIELQFYYNEKKISWNLFLELSKKYNCLNENVAIVSLIEVLQGEKKIIQLNLSELNSEKTWRCYAHFKNHLIPSKKIKPTKSFSEQIFFETEHLPKIKRIFVAIGRLFPSREFLKSRYGKANNYLLSIIKRYAVYLKR